MTFGKVIVSSLELVDRLYNYEGWTFKADHYRHWHFIAITYDPATNNAWCALDTDFQQMTMTPYTQNPPSSLKFNDEIPYFIDDIVYYLQLTDRYFLCTRWPVEPDHYLRWHFYAVTYDPATDNAWCILDTELRQMTITTYSQSQPPALKFGGGQPFFIDDIVYYPKTSTTEMIEAVYNQSEFIYHKDVPIRKFLGIYNCKIVANTLNCGLCNLLTILISSPADDGRTTL